MRTARIRTATLAAVTAALALGLTACGGADDSGSKAAGGDSAAGTTQNRSASHGENKGGAEQAIGGGTKEDVRSEAAPGGTQEAAGKGQAAGSQQCRGMSCCWPRCTGSPGSRATICWSPPRTRAASRAG
ncbi:hypothetical protein ABZ840_37420 [Streptomyces sp. NPDC047117]|uniref:hypothetical protein n=1 Tax=Streptomyces sp. NPDC047117 TaxID=3155379 RepID=UPI0033F6CC0B